MNTSDLIFYFYRIKPLLNFTIYFFVIYRLIDEANPVIFERL